MTAAAGQVQTTTKKVRPRQVPPEPGLPQCGAEALKQSVSFFQFATHNNPLSCPRSVCSTSNASQRKRPTRQSAADTVIITGFEGPKELAWADTKMTAASRSARPDPTSAREGSSQAGTNKAQVPTVSSGWIMCSAVPVPNGPEEAEARRHTKNRAEHRASPETTSGQDP
jgi:hypothetical protein